MKVVEEPTRALKIQPLPLPPIVSNDDARGERRRSKSCSHVPLNRTQIVRVGEDETLIVERRSRGAHMSGIREDETAEKSPRSGGDNQVGSSGGKPRTPCYERLYKHRVRSVTKINKLL